MILVFSFYILLLGVVYSVVVSAAASVQLLKQMQSHQLPVAQDSTKERVLGARELVVITLSGVALLGGLVLISARPQLPEERYVPLLVVAFPLTVGCATLAVVLSSAKGLSSIRGWNYVALVLGTVTLLTISIWLLSPAIFAP